MKVSKELSEGSVVVGSLGALRRAHEPTSAPAMDVESVMRWLGEHPPVDHILDVPAWTRAVRSCFRDADLPALFDVCCHPDSDWAYEAIEAVRALGLNTWDVGFGRVVDWDDLPMVRHLETTSQSDEVAEESIAA